MRADNGRRRIVKMKSENSQQRRQLNSGEQLNLDRVTGAVKKQYSTVKAGDKVLSLKELWPERCEAPLPTRSFLPSSWRQKHSLSPRFSHLVASLNILPVQCPGHMPLPPCLLSPHNELFLFRPAGWTAFPFLYPVCLYHSICSKQVKGGPHDPQVDVTFPVPEPLGTFITQHGVCILVPSPLLDDSPCRWGWGSTQQYALPSGRTWCLMNICA